MLGNKRSVLFSSIYQQVSLENFTKKTSSTLLFQQGMLESPSPFLPQVLFIRNAINLQFPSLTYKDCNYSGFFKFNFISVPSLGSMGKSALYKKSSPTSHLCQWALKQRQPTSKAAIGLLLFSPQPLAFRAKLFTEIPCSNHG